MVKDTRNRTLADEAGPEFYLSENQEPWSRLTLLVRTDMPPKDIAAAILYGDLVGRSEPADIAPDVARGSHRTQRPGVSPRHLAVGRVCGRGVVLMTLGVYGVV